MEPAQDGESAAVEQGGFSLLDQVASVVDQKAGDVDHDGADLLAGAAER